MELSEHLFRREAGRMVAALTRIFGVQNLALAEDVVQDAFCRALGLEISRRAGGSVRVANGDSKEPGTRCPAALSHGAYLRAGTQ